MAIGAVQSYGGEPPGSSLSPMAVPSRSRLKAPGRRVCYAPGPVGWVEQAGHMWHLVEDFFEQGLIAKLFIAVGWLAVLIMVASFVGSLVP